MSPSSNQGSANQNMYGGNLNAFDSKVNTNVPAGTAGIKPESNPSYSTGPSSAHVTEGAPVNSSDVDVSIGDKGSEGYTYSSNKEQTAGQSHSDDRSAGKSEYSAVDKVLNKIPGVHPAGGM